MHGDDDFETLDGEPVYYGSDDEFDFVECEVRSQDNREDLGIP